MNRFRKQQCWFALLLALATICSAATADATNDRATHLRSDEQPTVLATTPLHVARLKDLSTIEGIRDNQLIGYGLVVGLAGTGDKQQTIFSIQTLGNMLQRMGINIKSQISNIQVRNIAAVFVTATIPPFSRPGMKMDVTVSSIGDAKSLAGGTLI